MVSVADRKTSERRSEDFAFDVAANAILFVGTMGGINTSGFLVPVTADPTIRRIGLILGDRFGAAIDNTGGSDGKIIGRVRYGLAHLWNNSSGGDELLAQHIGQTVFAADNDTVALTNGGSTRPIAGTMVDIDPLGVWVKTTIDLSIAGGLDPANNLSDVANVATSRGNLGVQDRIVFTRVNLIGATGEIYRYVHRGPDATVVNIDTGLTAALAVGNAVITSAINAVDITDGLVTILQAGSAAGDLDTAVPSASNTITDGQVLTLTVSGANTAAAFVDVSINLTY